MQNNNTHSAQANLPLIVALIIALAAGAWLLKGFFSLIVAAMIVAYLFRPVYLRLQKKTPSKGAAAALTLVITFIVILIPLLLVLTFTIWQSSAMIAQLSTTVSPDDITRMGTAILKWVNDVASRITGGQVVITPQDISSHLSELASKFATFVFNTLSGWAGSIGSIVTNTILYIYVFTAVLVYHEKLVDIFTRLNPLNPKVSKLYLERAGGMTKAMIRGQFIVAIVQGFISSLCLSLVGIDYFAFFFLILTLLSIIPLGAGIVTIPIGIFLILTGNYWQGAIVLLNHFLVVTNIDNVLKPRLVPKAVRMQSALLLLSIFGGISIFGFLGIVVGPVIMILIITTIEVYLRVTTPAKPVDATSS